MEVKVISEKKNILLKRREVLFSVSHQGQGTPSRLEVKEKLASLLNADLDCIFIKKMETKTGSSRTIGEANVYDDREQAERIEPEHIISRNKPDREEGGEEG